MVQITLPDGSQRQYPGPVTVAEVAQSIGAGLAKAALAGRVAFDGAEPRLVDTSFRIDNDAQLAIVTAKDADGLDLIRHSTAHLLAYAVKSLFPDAQVTIGPVIDNGFYYDFSYKRPFTPEDLQAIEKKMAELARRTRSSRARNGRVTRLSPISRASARSTRRRSLPRFRPTKPSACTGKAISSTCAAAPTCPRPAS